MRGLLAHTRGIVMLEFVMVMVPLMLAFLGAVQFAFLATAKLTLRHSATLAVRAASVVVEESVKVEGAPEDVYEGLAAGLVEVEKPEESDSNADKSTLDSVVSSAPSEDLSEDNSTPTEGPLPAIQSLLGVLGRAKTRINDIRTAAYIPMLAISPNALADIADVVADPTGELGARWADNDNVENAIGGASIGRLAGAFLYNLGALAVTFETEAPGDDEPEAAQDELELDQVESEEAATIELERGADVTVRISYLFRCKVPLVSVLMCDSGWAIYTGSAWFDVQTYFEVREVIEEPPQSYEDIAKWEQKISAVENTFARRQENLDRIGDAGAHWKKVEVPLMQTLLLFRPGARYKLLSSRATLPLQSARYYPRLSEDPGDSEDSEGSLGADDAEGVVGAF